MNLQNICEQVVDIAKDTGKYIAEEATKISCLTIEQKGKNNFVTHVDKTAEKNIVLALTKILPEAGFIVEENTVQQHSEKFNWIVDPLDGTTNFIHGIPCYSVSIALVDSDENILLGVVYEISKEECFYATQNGGAFLNGKKISVSKNNTLQNSLLATGFPYEDFGKLNNYIRLTENLMQHSQGIRRIGSASVDLAYVACGRFDGFYEYNLNAWDVAAGILLVKEANGSVCDFKGGNNFLFGKEIIAAQPDVCKELLEKIEQHF